MGVLAIGLSRNFGLAGTIVQERAPAPLRGRISAIFGLSFFGLMPIAGLVITGFADLVGMRTALVVCGSFRDRRCAVLTRQAHGLRMPGSPVPETDAAPVTVV